MRNHLVRRIIPPRRIPHHPMKILRKHEAIHRLGSFIATTPKKKTKKKHQKDMGEK
jgi:hypothetical protein